MAGISVRAAVIAVAAAALAAVAGVSWVGADQQAATPAASVTAAHVASSAPIPVAAPATVKPPSAPGGRHAAGHGAPKAVERPVWSELSQSQQEALQPLASEWDTFEHLRKQKYLNMAKLYSSMTADEQQRMHEKMRDWIKMTPAQREVVRENYTRSKKIESSNKSAQWEQYQQLPEEQKQKLAAEAAVKKRVVNLPSPSQAKVKPIAPIKSAAAPSAPALAQTPAASAAATAAPGGPATAAPAAATPVPPAVAPPSSVLPSNVK